MSQIKTQTENPKGLHQRYFIQKIVRNPDYKKKITSTFMGHDSTNEFLVENTDPKAEYFVLRLDIHGSDINHIKACRKAIIMYAVSIEPYLPKLAKDLIERYGDILY